MQDFNSGFRNTTTRAPWHDYNSGTYHVVICTNSRTPFFGHISVDANGAARMELSDIGALLARELETMRTRMPYAFVPVYAIMPDHVHILIVIDGEMPQMGGSALGQKTALGEVVRRTKGRVKNAAKQIDSSFGWQANYYETILDCKEKVKGAVEYIEGNVAKDACKKMGVRW